MIPSKGGVEGSHGSVPICQPSFCVQFAPSVASYKASSARAREAFIARPLRHGRGAPSGRWSFVAVSGYDRGANTARPGLDEAALSVEGALRDGSEPSLIADMADDDQNVCSFCGMSHLM